jgi:ribosomal-protein-serine acetyltransferase
VDSTKNVEDTKSFISMTQKQFSSNDGFQAGIFVDNKIEGVICLHRIDWSNKKTSIGYWLSEKSQGNGAMTKSCIALIDHAFNILNLNKVEISCASENLKSQNIPKRLKFIEEGISRDAEWLYDHFVNHINYGILKSEWKR